MARIVTVSAIQLPAWKEGETLEEVKTNNLKTIFEMLEIAGKRNSDVAVFGEYSNVRGIEWNNESGRKFIDTVPGPLVKRLSEIAKKYSMNLVAPIVGLCDGKLRNVALIINREGRLIGQYYKVHLPAPEAEWGIVAGDDIPIFELDFGKIGVMTCMDIEYPEHTITLMLKGAQIIFFPHVQSSWGEVDWEIRYRARAIDTGLYLVSSCYGYKEGEWRPGMMIGRSGIIGPDGMILAEASRWVEVVTREIDLDKKRITNFHFAKNCDRTLAVMASRRPEAYGELVNQVYQEQAMARAEKEYLS
jgi:predicted amidohydrolase